MAPQLSYPTAPPAAVPGMLMDNDADFHGKGLINTSGVVIPYGVGVEFDAAGNGCQIAQDTGATDPSFAGVTVYDAGDEPGGYNPGDMVRVVRRGRVAVTTVGTAVVQTDIGTAANLSHSSTVATDRGKFTKSATSGTAGSEVADVGATWRGPTGVTNLAWIELNLP